MICISVENGEAFNLDFWICFKTVEVVWMLINCKTESEVWKGNFEDLGH